MVLITKASGSGLPGLLIKGSISIASDFPDPLVVKTGWVYKVLANVTDNDPTKTNTGLSFLAGDIIYRDGISWLDITGLEVWLDDGTNVVPLNSRDVNIETGKEYKINNISIIDNTVTLGVSTTTAPSQLAVKTYADNVDDNAFFYAIAFG